MSNPKEETAVVEVPGVTVSRDVLKIHALVEKRLAELPHCYNVARARAYFWGSWLKVEVLD